MLMEGHTLIEMKACGHVTKETNVDRSVGITATFEGNRIVQLMCNGGKLKVRNFFYLTKTLFCYNVFYLIILGN